MQLALITPKDIHPHVVSRLAATHKGTYGHVAIVELLLSKGAAVNAVQKNDMTALLFATQYGFATVREVLLRWGALDLNS